MNLFSVRDFFEAVLKSGQVSHAYLFVGPRGSGKTSAARILSQVVNCELNKDRRDNLLDPCGECSSCLSLNKGGAVDVIEIDAASNGLVEDIRDLREKVRLAPANLRKKVYIIDEVHMLTKEAFNALLKTLEEPPEHLVFILTTQAQSSLLPTIISRARSLRFLRLPRRELQPILEEVNEDDAHFILRLAQGAPGIVYRLRDDPDSLRLEKQVYEKALSFWGTASLKSRLQILTSLHTRGDEADRFLTHLALSLRQQPPRRRELLMPPFMELARSLRTNAHRQLAAQYFALVTAP